MDEFENYKQRMIAGIEDWQADLEKLREQTDKQDAEKQKLQQDAISRLQEKIAHNKEKLRQFEQSGREAWKAMKKGLDEAWDDLSDAFREAKSKF